MAQELEGHLEEWRGPGAPRRYPWDEWLNGKVWEITPEDHPGTDSHLFRQYARKVAKERGMQLRARNIGTGPNCNVQIQAIIP